MYSWFFFLIHLEVFLLYPHPGEGTFEKGVPGLLQLLTSRMSTAVSWPLGFWWVAWWIVALESLAGLERWSWGKASTFIQEIFFEQIPRARCYSKCWEYRDEQITLGTCLPFLRKECWSQDFTDSSSKCRVGVRRDFSRMTPVFVAWATACHLLRCGRLKDKYFGEGVCLEMKNSSPVLSSLRHPGRCQGAICVCRSTGQKLSWEWETGSCWHGGSLQDEKRRGPRVESPGLLSCRDWIEKEPAQGADREWLERWEEI